MNRTMNRKLNRKINQDEVKELGFGSSVFAKQQRLINKDGSTNIRREGLNFLTRFDTFQTLVAMPWLHFHSTILCAYVLVNLVFATAYYAIGIEHLAGIENKSSGENFLECFFFSTQTFTTVGYGRVSPQGLWANCIATLESMTGLLSFALATGLIYGRFSKPSSRLIYSENILIGKVQNQDALMFRVANARSSQVIEVEAQLVLAYLDLTRSPPKRLFNQLSLQLSKINVLSLGWTVVHFIDEDSPLWGLTLQELQEQKIEIMVLLKGFDELYSQTLYSRHSYIFEELILGANFVSMVNVDEDGKTILELQKLNSFLSINE